MRTAVRNLQFTGGETYTNQALDQARDMLRPGRPGYRPSVQQIVIIVTDGVPNPGNLRQPAINSGSDLQRLAKCFAIGITDEIDFGILALLSSPPRQPGVSYFTSPDFEALENNLRPLLESVCTTEGRMYHIYVIRYLYNRELTCVYYDASTSIYQCYRKFHVSSCHFRQRLLYTVLSHVLSLPLHDASHLFYARKWSHQVASDF